MKPAWDKLMAEFDGSVFDVDCTAAGQSLCTKQGVRGYPTIKYGEPGDLKDYNGGRDFASLKKFAEANLGPSCGPADLELCDDATKTKLEKYMGWPKDKLEKKIVAVTEDWEDSDCEMDPDECSKKTVNNFTVELPLMSKVAAHLAKNPSREEL